MKQESLRRFISFGLLVALVLIFSLSSSTFMTKDNILNLLRESSIVGVLAIGITMVIITGGNDLSCGALLGLAAMAISRVLVVYELSVYVAFAVALVICLVGGLFNGFLVSVLRIPDFIATLASKFVFSGLTLVIALRSETGMITSKPLRDSVIRQLGQATSGGIYYSVIIFAVLAVIAQFILKNTKRGTYIYAIGSNRTSAELSGISFVKTKLFAFVVSGFCAFVSSLLFLGKLRAADVESGIGMEFQAISATVIGGCSFAGGHGDIVGSVIGVLFMKALENGMLKFNFSSEMQKVLSGAVIVIMLVFDAAYNKYMNERILKLSGLKREKMSGKVGA